MATAALGGLGRLRADARAKTTRAKTRRRANARGSRAKLGALQTPVEGADGGASAGEGGLEARARPTRGRDAARAASARSLTRASVVAMRSDGARGSNGSGGALKEISWTHCVENLGKGDPGVEHDYKRVVFVTPDDGFIMGARKTLYHLNGCPCPTCNVFRCRVRNGVDISGEPIKVVVISEKEFETLKAVGTVKDMAKVEQLRRRRIGTANTGKVPWNKGGKHSKETIEKIRATTLMHMANPAYRERLKASYNGSNARHSEYTRAKIKRASVERARARKLETAGLESKQVWGLKRGMNGAASAGIFVRRNSAVMTVTFGVNGTADIARLRQRQKDEEKVRLKTQRELKKQLVATLVLKRRAMRKVKPKVANKRTREHRAKISKAIADKWRDPEYSAKMRKKRKNSAASAASQQHPSVDPAKKKLLAEIKAMYLKADAAVKTLRARADNGLTVDPAMLAQATQTRKQTRTMLETVRKNIEQEFQARDAAAAAKKTARPR